MQFSFVKKRSAESIALYPVFKRSAHNDPTIKKLLLSLLRSKEFHGNDGEVFYLLESRTLKKGPLLLVGLGNAKKLNTASVLNAFASAIKSAASHHAKKVTLCMSEELEPFVSAIAEGLVLGQYQPGALYKTGKAKEKLLSQRVQMIEIIDRGGRPEIQAGFKKAFALGQIVNEARDWVNSPPNIATIDFFVQRGKDAARLSSAHYEVLKKKHLEKLKMGAFLGVNRGSKEEAALLILDYRPKGYDKSQAPIVLVGKGILFDSGGYNLKPRGYIEDMHLDKAGAASLIALVKALPLLHLTHRIVVLTPFTDNAIGPTALKPSEILTTYSGKTVEITNTDGEGRLILCDTISYAIARFKPRFIIDVATLTGACMVALGERYAGLFSNDEELGEKLRKAGDEVDELLWPLPIHKDDAAKMKGVYADLRNADLGSEKFCGASKGAAFIREFVGKTKWAHIDIASPAFVSDPKKYEHKGATGFGVRLLARFLENI